METVIAAYIAGYFDGEGSVTTSAGNGNPTVRICITQRDPVPLQRIRDELGFGKLYAHARESAWVLQMHRRDDVIAFVRAIYRFARQKKAQLRLAFRIASRMRTANLGSRQDARTREMRRCLADELRSVNLRGRTSGTANRHGRRPSMIGAV